MVLGAIHREDLRDILSELDPALTLVGALALSLLFYLPFICFSRGSRFLVELRMYFAFDRRTIPIQTFFSLIILFRLHLVRLSPPESRHLVFFLLVIDFFIFLCSPHIGGPGWHFIWIGFLEIIKALLLLIVSVIRRPCEVRPHLLKFKLLIIIK